MYQFQKSSNIDDKMVSMQMQLFVYLASIYLTGPSQGLKSQGARSNVVVIMCLPPPAPPLAKALNLNNYAQLSNVCPPGFKNISKPLYLVYKNFQDRKPFNIFVAILVYQCLHIYILNLINL